MRVNFSLNHVRVYRADKAENVYERRNESRSKVNAKGLFTLQPVSSPLSMAAGGADHRTKAAVVFITPTRISVGGELGGPSNVLPVEQREKNEFEKKNLSLYNCCGNFPICFLRFVFDSSFQIIYSTFSILIFGLHFVSPIQI